MSVVVKDIGDLIDHHNTHTKSGVLWVIKVSAFRVDLNFYVRIPGDVTCSLARSNGSQNLGTDSVKFSVYPGFCSSRRLCGKWQATREETVNKMSNNNRVEFCVEHIKRKTLFVCLAGREGVTN